MWVFKQSTGELFDYTGKLIDKGYAGMGIGKDNPAMQDVKNVGPIPEAMYHIGAPVNDTKLGPWALPLTPLAGFEDQMFGRSGFYMHSDSLTHPGQASEGCIVISTTARMAIVQSGDKVLEVIA